MLHALLLLQAAACPATPAALPPALAGWAPQTTVTASAGADTPLPIGRGVRATLRPTPGVTLAAPVARPPAAASSSGVFAFTAPKAGRYRVALSGAAWIDVVRDGKPLTSIAHGHGPACSGVRKMVDFDLGPGAYRLQVVGSATPTITVMVTTLP